MTEPKGFATLCCDAAGCDHVERVGEVTADMIGRPCPKCGANLLTQEDFDASYPTFQMLKLMEALGLAKSPDDAASDGVAVSIHHHAGETTVKIGKPDGAAA